MFLFDVVISESLADLTNRPQNVIVLDDENATLECSTDTTSQGSSAIEWKYDRTLIVHRPCQPADATYIITSPDSQTDCNIVALAGADRGISGPYECSEGGFTQTAAVAMIIVVGT